jgi:hypothetical protein
LRFANSRACFDAESGVHCVLRAKWREMGGKLPNVSIRNKISVFSSKSTNVCDLRVALLLSTLKVSSITFAVLNGVKRAVNFDMYQSGTQYQSFRLNRQMAVFCEFQGLFRR